MVLLKRTGFTVLAVIVLLCLYMGWEQWTGNFHEVIPGEFYRSAQPTPEDIDKFHRLYGIASVINLRDAINAATLRREKQAAEKAGMTFYHFPFSSRERLPADKIRALAEMMRQAPKPLLVHCYHGADRSGLAAAIYLAQTGRSRLFSAWQLSPWYGHIPIPFIGNYAMDKSWHIYKNLSKF